MTAGLDYRCQAPRSGWRLQCTVAALQGEGAETVAMRGAGGEFPGAVRAAVAAAAGAVAAGAAAEVVPPEVVGAGCEQAVGPI
mmetsp:Transcript_27314/g.77064  ORF Transcript_27314/g.77064 Transcript_27314/m.77064 type:complete len:83 (-) Transcript_27314:416-664(-)